MQPGLKVERVAGKAVEPTPIKAQGVCPRQCGHVLNRWTGQKVPVRCGTWACPVCGHAKKKRLCAAAIAAFSTEKFLSLWTFTLSSDLGWTLDEHSAVMLGAWRRFVIKVRQKWLGRITTQGLKMFRVVEQHRSGAIHFHVMMNRFLNKERIKLLWMICVIRQADSMGLALPYDRKLCEANVAPTRGRGKPDARTVACYVAKYVTKTLQSMSCQSGRKVQTNKPRRLWSTSRRFVTIATARAKRSTLRLWTFHRGTASELSASDRMRLYLFHLRVMLQRQYSASDDPDPFDRWIQPSLWSF